MEEWCWDSSIWDFVETIQWTLVFRQLSKEKPLGWSKMVSDPKIVEQKANEYGMTYRAITNEMLRIGRDLNNMLDIIEKDDSTSEKECVNDQE